MTERPAATDSVATDCESSKQSTLQRVVIISGPSGSGKSTVVDRLIAESPVPLIKMISATTRPRRENEIDGQDYYFLTNEEFTRQRDNGEFVEFEEVHSAGYWYGTLKSELNRATGPDEAAFLEIDVKGALKVMEQFPDATTIFLKTPSEDVFEQRLRDRRTEPEEVIQRRLRTAREELQFADRYRHQVVNDNLDRAVAEIIDILTTRETESHA